MAWLYVGVGAFFGANARYWVGGWVAERMGGAFPYGTLLINVTGSFLVGFLATYLGARTFSPNWRLLLMVGFLGGYTTFSSFAYEAATLIENRNLLFAFLYFAASPFFSLVAAFAGMVLGRLL